jgi:prefoldin subunit 5
VSPGDVLREGDVYDRELEQSAEELRRELRGIASKLGAVHKELSSYIEHATEPGSRTTHAGRAHVLRAVEDTIPVLEQQIRDLRKAQLDLRQAVRHEE